MKRLRSESGLTLMEVTIVMVLASLVMVGMVGFYISSQATWTDASGQAMTQRDATAALERLTQEVHQASSALVTQPAPYQQVTLFDVNGRAFYAMRADPTTEHLQESNGGSNFRLVVAARVNRFEVTAGPTVVELTMLELRTASGQPVNVSSTITMLNHP